MSLCPTCLIPTDLSALMERIGAPVAEVTMDMPLGLSVL